MSLRKRSGYRIGWITGILAVLRLVVCGSALASGRPTAKEALAFCEQLEPIIEAVTDGKPARVPAATHSAELWWRAHAPDSADATAMRRLRELADSHRAPAAAATAVEIAGGVLDRCAEPEAIDVAVMRIDLAGMAAWLRSKGIESATPGEMTKAIRRISSELRRRGNTLLARRIETELVAAVAIPTRVNGPTARANALLERVDEVEAALRKKK